MIRRIELNGIGPETNKDLKRYVMRKIAGLDKYIPRHMRRSVHVRVRLKEEGSVATHKYSCDAQLFLPGEDLTATEATMNMFAAVDIVEEKLKQQLKKYKEMHGIERHKHSGRRLKKSVRQMFKKDSDTSLL